MDASASPLVLGFGVAGLARADAAQGALRAVLLCF
jgi:hypothetical protein